MRKPPVVLLALVLLASPAWAMQKRFGQVRDAGGRTISGATVTVYRVDTPTLATLYSDNGVTRLSNPITVNAADGYYYYYAANGRYREVITKSGFTFDPRQTLDIRLFDPVDVGVLNVIEYGAKGDGSADDSIAIQAALTAARPGQTVRIPHTGNPYKIGTGLTTLGGIIIEGSGHGYSGTRLKYTGSGRALLTIQSRGYTGTVIRDLALENAGSGSVTAIEVNYTFITLDRLEIGPFSVGATGFAKAIRVTSPIGGAIFPFRIHDSHIFWNDVGLELVAADQVLLTGNFFDSNKINVRAGTSVVHVLTVIGGGSNGDFSVNGTNHIGFDIQNVSTWMISGVDIEPEVRDGSSNTTARGIRTGQGVSYAGQIVGNWFNGVGSTQYLIEMTGVATQTRSLRIAGNQFYRADTAIYMNGTDIELGLNFVDATVAHYTNLNDTKYSGWVAASASRPFRIDSAIKSGGTTFAELKAYLTENGMFIYCSDCMIANPCASGGTGAFAKRLNGANVCN